MIFIFSPRSFTEAENYARYDLGPDVTGGRRHPGAGIYEKARVISADQPWVTMGFRGETNELHVLGYPETDMDHRVIAEARYREFKVIWAGRE